MQAQAMSHSETRTTTRASPRKYCFDLRSGICDKSQVLNCQPMGDLLTPILFGKEGTICRHLEQ